MIKIEPVKDPHDAQLKFLEQLGMSFKKMDNSVLGSGIRDLTSDTSKALHQTLNDIAVQMFGKIMIDIYYLENYKVIALKQNLVLFVIRVVAIF